MARISRIVFMMMFVVPVVLTGCADFLAYEEDEFLEPDEELLRKGGIMTGESGEFIIYQR